MQGRKEQSDHTVGSPGGSGALIGGQITTHSSIGCLFRRRIIQCNATLRHSPQCPHLPFTSHLPSIRFPLPFTLPLRPTPPWKIAIQALLVKGRMPIPCQTRDSTGRNERNILRLLGRFWTHGHLLLNDTPQYKHLLTIYIDSNECKKQKSSAVAIPYANDARTWACDAFMHHPLFFRAIVSWDVVSLLHPNSRALRF
jgi:hypothetical protein